MRLDTKLLIGLCAMIFQVGCGKSSFSGSSATDAASTAGSSASSDDVNTGASNNSVDATGGVVTGRLLEISTRIPQVGVPILVVTANGIFSSVTDANGHYSISLPATTILNLIATNYIDFPVEISLVSQTGISASENPNIDLFSDNTSPSADASAGSLAPYSISGIVENAAGQAVATNVLLIYHTPSLSFGNQISSFGPSGFSFSVAGGANTNPGQNQFLISAPNHSYAAVNVSGSAIGGPLILSR